MILYIHGFRTTYDSYMATLLKEYFKDTLISSDHSHEPEIAIKEFEEIIHKQNVRGIIASSLGGYYATYLGNKHHIKTVLINPSVEPHLTTRQYLGNIEKNDGTTFEWSEKHLTSLSHLWVKNLDAKLFYIFLKKSDAILDYTVAQKRYKGAKMLIEDGGDHRFSDLQKYLEKIKNFLE